MYFDRTLAQQIGSAKVKSESEVTHYVSTEHRLLKIDWQLRLP